MKNFSLIDIQNIDPQTWQKIALLYPHKKVQEKHLSLDGLFKNLSYSDTFLKILTFTAQQNANTNLRRELDTVALKVLRKIKFKTNNRRNVPILRDVITHLESGRKSDFKTHDAVKDHENGKTNHNGGKTPEVIDSIIADGIICEQGCDCFIHNGENYIIFSILRAVLNKNWQAFFSSIAFKTNPEVALERQSGDHPTMRNPYYKSQGNLTSAIMPEANLKKLLQAAILRS